MYLHVRTNVAQLAKHYNEVHEEEREREKRQLYAYKFGCSTRNLYLKRFIRSIENVFDSVNNF